MYDYDIDDFPHPASFDPTQEFPSRSLPDDALGRAIKATWPREHPDYWCEIYSRYAGTPIDRAINGVRQGYSSPGQLADF